MSRPKCLLCFRRTLKDDGVIEVALVRLLDLKRTQFCTEWLFITLFYNNRHDMTLCGHTGGYYGVCTINHRARKTKSGEFTCQLPRTPGQQVLTCPRSADSFQRTDQCNASFGLAKTCISKILLNLMENLFIFAALSAGSLEEE